MPSNALWRITPSGTDALHDGGGNAEVQVLAALETGGTSRIDTIIQGSGLSKGQAERALLILARKKRVKFVDTEEDDDMD